MTPTKDKCQICKFEADTSYFDINDGACPNCGSYDVDDINAKPYEDDQEGQLF